MYCSKKQYSSFSFMQGVLYCAPGFHLLVLQKYQDWRGCINLQDRAKVLISDSINFRQSQRITYFSSSFKC